ncbi:MAG: uroporphyrinogen decarboxylase family protein [Verrucomicrobiota bacterium]
MMDSKKRLLKAWNFEEPDRVPIEIQISPAAREYPEAQEIVEFIDNEADNFTYMPGADWGFFGIPVKEQFEEVIEETDRFCRKKRTIDTEAGVFYAITKQDFDEINKNDFHWERRYIDTIEDMERLADAPKGFIGLFGDRRGEAEKKLGKNQVGIDVLFHPLGNLVRQANMDEVYIWMATHPETMHRFLESSSHMVMQVVEKMVEAGMGPNFYTVAHEMLIPPWMGGGMFDEYVFGYDKPVYDAIHRHGGKLRAHCHDNVFNLLEKFSAMGVDGIEPLEPPPYGDVDLAEAKKLVGDRMMLSGNVATQDFVDIDADEVSRRVKEAVAAGAPGGGFSLRTTGGHAATGSVKTREQMLKVLENIQAYIDAGLKYGSY